MTGIFQVKGKSDFNAVIGTREWSISTPEFKAAFMLHMRNKNFGREETLDAFENFRAGWDAFVRVALRGRDD